MPSFDIVSEVDLHQLTNAVDQASRVIDTRFDFKGTEASFVRNDYTVTLTADSEFQLNQMLDILRGALVKCRIDSSCMDAGKVVSAGKQVKKDLTIRHGLDDVLSKKIVKMIKEGKVKVQAAIQGDKVRVTGKKRDDLQQVIAVLRESDLGMPLQFDNFRD